MADRCEKLPSTIVFSERILVLATCDAETLSYVHVHKEVFKRRGCAFVVAIENFYPLGKVMGLQVGIEHLGIDPFLLGAAKGTSQTADIESGCVDINEPLLEHFRQV